MIHKLYFIYGIPQESAKITKQCFRSSTANRSKEMIIRKIEPVEKREQLDAKTNTTQNMVRKKVKPSHQLRTGVHAYLCLHVHMNVWSLMD